MNPAVGRLETGKVRPGCGCSSGSELLAISWLALALGSMNDPRITWVRGAKQAGPEQLIGVLELKADGSCRAVFAERTEVEGRSHIRLARTVWPGKDSLETRWWSLVLDEDHKVRTIRNGSCSDPLLNVDVPRITRALEELELLGKETMLAVDDGPIVLLRS
jgi:hypothetical protein